MKYKHEFAINHLPMVFFGGVLYLFSFVMYGFALHNYLYSDASIGSFFLVLIGLAAMIVGSFMASEGIEYTTTLNTDPTAVLEAAKNFNFMPDVTSNDSPIPKYSPESVYSPVTDNLDDNDPPQEDSLTVNPLS